MHQGFCFQAGIQPRDNGEGRCLAEVFDWYGRFSAQAFIGDSEVSHYDELRGNANPTSLIELQSTYLCSPLKKNNEYGEGSGELGDSFKPFWNAVLFFAGFFGFGCRGLYLLKTTNRWLSGELLTLLPDSSLPAMR